MHVHTYIYYVYIHVCVYIYMYILVYYEGFTLVTCTRVCIGIQIYVVRALSIIICTYVILIMLRPYILRCIELLTIYI
jgi:hypothetical protein